MTVEGKAGCGTMASILGSGPLGYPGGLRDRAGSDADRHSGGSGGGGGSGPLISTACDG
jgi:hypothetical protein